MKFQNSFRISLSLLACLFAARLLAQSEEAAVRQTVEKYIHGLKFNDVASLKAAFDPEAKLFWVRKDGTLGQLSQEQWYKGFEATAGKEQEGALGIVSIDVAGNAAAAKVREEYSGTIYTDYVTLLKLPAGWRIVNKVYFVEPKSAIH